MSKNKIIIGIVIAIAILIVVSVVTSVPKIEEGRAPTTITGTVAPPTIIQEPVKITDLRLVQVDNHYILFTLWDEDDNVMRDCKGTAIVKIVNKTGEVTYRGDFDVSHKDFHDMYTIDAYHFADVYVLQIYEDEIEEIGDIMRIELIFLTPSGKELIAERVFGG